MNLKHPVVKPLIFVLILLTAVFGFWLLQPSEAESSKGKDRREAASKTTQEPAKNSAKSNDQQAQPDIANMSRDERRESTASLSEEEREKMRSNRQGGPKANSEEPSEQDTTKQSGTEQQGQQQSRRQPPATMQMQNSITGGGRFGGTAPTINSTQVESIKVSPSNNQPTVPLLTQVDATKKETYLSPANTSVLGVNVTSGQTVNKGEPLFSLNNQTIDWSLRQQQAGVIQQQANIEIGKKQHSNNLATLTSAKNNLEREESLNNRGLSNESALQNAQDQLRSAQLQVDLYQSQKQQQQAQLDLAIIQLEQTQEQAQDYQPLAPFDGKVVELALKNGKNLNANDRILTFVDSSSYLASGQISISTFRQLTGGQTNFDTNNFSAFTVIDQQSIALTVHSVSAVSELGAIQIDFELPQNQSLVIGETLEVYLSLSPVLSYAIPSDAIYYGNKIYVIEKGRLKTVDITVIGYRINDINNEQFALIKSENLEGNVEILTTRLARPTNGTAVTVIER